MGEGGSNFGRESHEGYTTRIWTYKKLVEKIGERKGTKKLRRALGQKTERIVSIRIRHWEREAVKGKIE